VESTSFKATDTCNPLTITVKGRRPLLVWGSIFDYCHYYNCLYSYCNVITGFLHIFHFKIPYFSRLKFSDFSEDFQSTLNILIQIVRCFYVKKKVKKCWAATASLALFSHLVSFIKSHSGVAKVNNGNQIPFSRQLE
jgi:hypothetical protein